jgi:hypothetical protein
VIALQDDALVVRIDPRHGAELLELVDAATGRQLLARTPWSSAPAQGGELDEDAWVASWRGGWQVLLPNAGNACTVGGEPHGFHGRASVDTWTVRDGASDRASLGWTGHDLDVRRTIALCDGAVRIDTELACSGDAPVPLVMVEHLAVGVELLDPETEITLPSALAYELGDDGGPAVPPARATTWPELRLRDGTVERADHLTLDPPRSRMAALHGLAAGWAALRNPATGQGLALAWDVDWYAHMWLWHEARTLGDRWREITEVLILEPATVPHHAGLETAIRSGHVRWLAPGDLARTWIVARPFSSSAPVREVTTAARAR